jgi:hypothetical protein
MHNPVKVLVTWCPEKMKRLPSSRQYVTAAKFVGDADDWHGQSWSVVIEFASPEISHAESFEATARFLVKNAPWERLQSECVFELFEGSKKTASVRVLRQD